MWIDLHETNNKMISGPFCTCCRMRFTSGNAKLVLFIDQHNVTVFVKSNSVASTHLKRTSTAGGVDNVIELATDSPLTVATSKTYLQPRHHPAPLSPARSTPRATPELAHSPSGARGKRRPGDGSDSDSRRRGDERVRFAADTVVQTADGRAMIIDDSSTAAADRHITQSRRSLASVSGGNTLPVRLRGHQAARRTFPEFESRDAVDPRAARKSVQRLQARPSSTVLIDKDDQRPVPGGGAVPSVRMGSVPASMHALHRSNTTSSAAPRTREVGVVTQSSSRRVVDPNYHTTRFYHR